MIRERKVDLIGLLGIFILLFSFYLYSVFYSFFAKISLQLNFLNFPIFIGEIILFFCFILWLIKIYRDKIKLKNKIIFFILFYFCFVIFKAIFGYLKWGPLALRDAALFYYFIFAIFGYYFYQSSFFSSFFVKLSLLVIILISFSFKLFYYPFLPFYIFLFVGISFKFPKIFKILSFFLFCFFLYFFKDFIFFESRIVVSFVFAFLYIYAGLVCKISSLKIKSTIIIFSFFVLFFIYLFVFVKFPHFNPKNLIKEYRIYTQYLKEKIPSYNIKPIPSKLYREPEPIFKAKVPPKELAKVPPKELPLSHKINSFLWRFFMWQDALEELIEKKAFFGLDFGKPFRSKRVEILNWESGKDVGWLQPHNSYIAILYRSGVIGLFFLLYLVIEIVKIVTKTILKKDLSLLFFVASLIYFVILANFIAFLESPYFAIPFYSFFGLLFSYYKKCVE